MNSHTSTEDIPMAKSYIKNAQHHYSSGKCKLHHSEISLHMLEWLTSERQEIKSVGNDVEKREALCTIGDNVN